MLHQLSWLNKLFFGEQSETKEPESNNVVNGSEERFRNQKTRTFQKLDEFDHTLKSLGELSVGKSDKPTHR